MSTILTVKHAHGVQSVISILIDINFVKVCVGLLFNKILDGFTEVQDIYF